MENKVEVVQQLLSSINANVTAGWMFHRLWGRHFLSEIPATEKKQKPQKRCASCYSRNICKESWYQCGNCEQKPGRLVSSAFLVNSTAPNIESPNANSLSTVNGHRFISYTIYIFTTSLSANVTLSSFKKLHSNFTRGLMPI